MTLARVFHRPVFHALALGAAALLSACGGGSSNVGASESSGITGPAGMGDLVLMAGKGFVVDGLLETDTVKLLGIEWNVSALAITSPTLTLTNANCAVAQKTDRVLPTPGSSAVLPGSSEAPQTSSSWRCSVGITAPLGYTAPADYTLLLRGIDVRGNNLTYTRNLRVIPAV